MKNTIYILLFAITILSCRAQSPIVGLETLEHTISNGSYVKDLNNELDKFTGTWIFNNNDSTFIISLQKIEMNFNGDYYEDFLVGEYTYILNGFTLINTIPLLNSSPNDYDNRNIGGRYFISGQEYGCEDCGDNEKRIDLYFNDPDRAYLSSSIILRYLVDETNQKKISATIIATDGVILPYDGAPEEPRVPYGTYLMEKQ